MNNRQVSKAFADGKTEGKGSNLFIDGRAIYSYGHHYPIACHTNAERNGRNIVLFNSDGYSHTTAKHKSYVRSELSSYEVIECDTDQLKSYIDVMEYLGDMRGVLSKIDIELQARHARIEEKRANARTDRSREQHDNELDRITEMMMTLDSLAAHHIKQPTQDLTGIPL